jgi:pyruvate,water dikinase
LIEELHKIAELNKQISYNSVVVILLMQIYNAILRSRLQAVGVDFQDFALTEGLKELREYDPSDRLASLSKLYNCFDESTQERIKSSSFNHLQDIPGTEDFQQAFNEFIEQFGHMSDKTGEFDCIPWRENPDLILDMVTSYQSRNGQDSKMIQFRDLRVRGLRGWILKVFYRRARQFRLYREKYSSLYTYNLLLFRIYYLVLGDHLVQKGLIHSPEDIYYLYEEEVRSIVDGQVGDINFADLAAQRQDEMEQCQDYILPEVIYGDDLPPVVTATDEKLTGIPTSKGYYTGKTKVVHSISEFNKLNPGEVLVIPYSDVSWTPLFAKAGAVIAESGGMLSHSSIIAREYNIPAVVSASGAMQLDDNTLVSIDGYRGEIMIHANR